MYRRIMAVLALTAAVLGTTVWWDAGRPEHRVDAQKIDASVLALLPRAARYEKQTTRLCLDLPAGNAGQTRREQTESYTVYCYNRQDQPIRHISYDAEAGVSYTDYVYDKAGRCTWLILYMDGTQPYLSVENAYDERGRSVRQTTYRDGAFSRETKTVYKPRADGGSDAVVTSCGAQGNSSSDGTETLDEKDQIVVSTIDLHGQTMRATYEYDEHGQLVRSRVDMGDGQPNETVFKRTYDAQGNEIRLVQYENGIEQGRTETTYDAHGHMTRQVSAGLPGAYTMEVIYEPLG